jgi:phage shock protein A
VTLTGQFAKLAEVINRELDPQKLLREAVAEYNRRMAEINQHVSVR